MRASKTGGRIPVGPARGYSVGLMVLWPFVAAGIGCSPAAPPASSAVRSADRADHDHDHDHDDKHDHGHAHPPGKASTPAREDDHGDHDHGDDHAHPETLAAAVGELKTLWGHVKGALKAGERDKADEKVHAVGHLLEDFEGLIAREKAEAQDAGKKAAQEVFDCFDKLDEAFHGEEEDLGKLDLDALGGRLEAAIKTLEGLVGTEAKP